MHIEIVNPDVEVLLQKATQTAIKDYIGLTSDEDTFIIQVENKQITDLDWYWKEDLKPELSITMDQLNDVLSD